MSKTRLIITFRHPVPFASSAFKKSSTELRVDIPHHSNNMHAYSSNSSSGNVPNSPAPFIKNEPQDESRFLHQTPYHHPDAYSMSGHQSYQQGGFTDQSYSGGDGSIDPSELTMSSSMPIQQNGGFMQSYPNFSTSNNMGYMNGGIPDEDLVATLGSLSESHLQNGQFDVNHQNEYGPSHNTHNSLHGLFTDMEGDANRGPAGENGASVGATNIEHMYSHTPDNAPQSPYIRGFPSLHFRQQLGPYNGATAETPSSYNASPVIGSDSTQGTKFDQYMSTGKRKNRPAVLERTSSRKSPHSRSPHTPKTPGIGSLSLGGESSTVSAQPIQAAHMGGHRHHKSLSNQWEGTPGSYLDSPLSSPHSTVHAQIADVFKSGKHASLPAKVESGPGGHALQNTQEAKRRRRRESHNMVERRRRDNINERIQELSHLVPQHRLEDEKVRKHLVNNGSLSPAGGPGGSPPRATSMLAGGVGRRASGVTAPGAAGEEKDKGPNKGDILNGAVGWTRDLMWALHEKLEQEKQLRELVATLGGVFPFEPSEDDKRMSSELYTAVVKNGVHTFHYSRAPGTTLRVPGYTDYAGNPIGSGVNVRSPGVSPSGSAGKSGQNGGSARTTPSQQQPPQYWSQNGDGMPFKEEDEYTMDMS